MARKYNVLFLCTGNSSRSILAEAILNHRGAPHFHAFSAGSHPAGVVNAYALRQLKAAGLPTDGLRSKSWDEFAKPSAPEMDFIFTVCDSAAAEVCPVWPGHPATAHWGMPDPGNTKGTPEDMQRAFRHAFVTLERRIGLFVGLKAGLLDQERLKEKLSEIGRA